MNYYRKKDTPLNLHRLPTYIEHDGIGRGIPDGADLEPEYRVAIGEYLDVSPKPPAFDPTTHQLGEVALWDEDAGTVTMNVVAIKPDALYIPQEISRAKGLVICKQYGLLDTIKLIVAAKDLEDGISQIKFDNAGTFRRDDPLLQYVATQAGMSSAQLDTMFIEGEALWQ